MDYGMTMTAPSKETGLSKQTLGDRALESWNRFWFTPGDPTVLALIRICCGVITLYTSLAYTLDLQEFFGPNAWWNLEFANRYRHERPYWVEFLRGYEKPPEPVTDFQKAYVETYRQRFGGYYPPAPFPENRKLPHSKPPLSEAEFSFKFREDFGFDFRAFHMPFPQNKKQEDYLYNYALTWRQ